MFLIVKQPDLQLLSELTLTNSRCCWCHSDWQTWVKPFFLQHLCMISLLPLSLMPIRKKKHICDCFTEVPMATSWPRLFQEDASHFSFGLCSPQWLHLPAWCWCCGTDLRVFALNDRMNSRFGERHLSLLTAQCGGNVRFVHGSNINGSNVTNCLKQWACQVGDNLLLR